MSLSRRQILLGGIITGVGISIAASRFRLAKKSSEGSNIAYEADISATAMSQLQKSMNLKQPPINYNRQISKLLVRCCRLGTEQYLQGIKDANYNGAITSLDSYFPQLNRYEQIATFEALRELYFLEPIIKRTALKNIIPSTKLIYHGYILKSEKHNIIIFRGTQEPEDWIADLDAKQEEYQDGNPSLGKVHQGFYNLYRKHLATPVSQAISKLDKTVPCYVVGHSLGGAMAVLAAYDLALNFPQLSSQLQVYSYASPRVGNPVFAKSFNDLIPNCYHIVNYADSTWLLPPTQYKKSLYIHVGQPWSFVNQTGDLSPNHQLAAYQAAIDREVETFKVPIEPVSNF